MMLSDEVKLYEIIGPQSQVMYVDTQEFHIQVRRIDNVNTLFMLDSLENLHMME
jgi:hypothetical protein